MTELDGVEPGIVPVLLHELLVGALLLILPLFSTMMWSALMMVESR